MQRAAEPAIGAAPVRVKGVSERDREKWECGTRRETPRALVRAPGADPADQAPGLSANTSLLCLVVKLSRKLQTAGVRKDPPKITWWDQSLLQMER